MHHVSDQIPISGGCIFVSSTNNKDDYVSQLSGHTSCSSQSSHTHQCLSGSPKLGQIGDGWEDDLGQIGDGWENELGHIADGKDNEKDKVPSGLIDISTVAPTETENQVEDLIAQKGLPGKGFYICTVTQ